MVLVTVACFDLMSANFVCVSVCFDLLFSVFVGLFVLCMRFVVLMLFLLVSFVSLYNVLMFLL